MGHIVNPEREYRLLQRQLDHTLAGAPKSPVLTKILQLLYSPEQARLTAKIPCRPTSLKSLARKLRTSPKELGDQLDEMAQRGLVIDLHHNAERYYAFAPVVIGLFEFTFMRTGGELPTAELARLFDQYMDEEDRFVHSAFQSQTQIGRSFVREEALPQGDHTEILDWERASHIVRSASAIGVSRCACRHKASHLGKACDRPQEVCLSFNYAAESVIRHGFARPVTVDETMRILDDCKQAGLIQAGDNVQRKVTFICNCCGCCCEMVRAINTFGIRNAIVSSNWIMEVDASKCEGCGQCAKACPIEAIEIVAGHNGEKPPKLAVCDETLCLGCGVCQSACESGAIAMRPREKRVFTPETVFDRVVSMAIERGKLADLLFDNPQRLSHRALVRMVAILEKSPPFKAAMAIKPLRSAFLTKVVAQAKKRVGPLRPILD